MTRTTLTRTVEPMNAQEAGNAKPGILKGSAGDVALQRSPETAASRTSRAFHDRLAFTTSPGFAALRPAVDQEFEEPMVN